MRSLKIGKSIAGALGAACLAFGSGCGSKTATNVITLSVSSVNGTNIIVGSSTTLTATVSGTTNLGINWTPGCQFTTTTTDSTGKQTTSAAAACPSDGSLGTLSNETTTSPATATYTAPSSLPDQTKYPGLQILITVQSQQDTKKTGSAALTLNSGIVVNLTPSSATVPTKEQQNFSVSLTNDLNPNVHGVTWLITQQSPTSTTSAPNLTTCDPGCGRLINVTDTGVTYQAPDTVPTATTPAGASTTPASLTIVATPKADVAQFRAAPITIIQGGPITFNGITPTIAPQGATLWDIYLDAPNISSSSKITVTGNGGSHTFASTDPTNQIKILFPIPTSTTPSPTSTGARLRLLESDLGVTSTTGAPITYTVTVSDPAECGATGVCAGSFPFTSMPVRPTVVGASPTGIVQGSNFSSDFPLSIDGGYFGPGGLFANVFFQNTVPQAPQTSSNSRQLNVIFPSSAIGPPGLYPLSVARTTPPIPIPNNPAVTTMAVFPDYVANPPAVPPGSATAAGTNPSAIDIDPILDVLAVAETGSNAVEFFSISPGGLTSIGTANNSTAGVNFSTPTGVAVNRNKHTVAVVSYGTETKNSNNQFTTANQSLTVLQIPTTAGAVTALFSLDLSGLLASASSPSAVPVPLPYAVGIDQDTNLALVAYSSVATPSFGNLGFVFNLNQGADSLHCPLQDAINRQTNPGAAAAAPPCLYSQVTLDTGAYPQIAMAPHGHTAYVTPGGSGIVRGVDLTKTAVSFSLGNVTLTSGGTVTATTASNARLTGLIPGNSYAVLISGVPAISNAPSLNGLFSISISSDTTFTYFVGNTTASGSVTGGTASFGTGNVNFGGLSQTTQGIAINAITNTAALADADATGQNGPQINLLNQLDQSVSSIRFFAGCIASTQNCSNAPELVGTGTGTARVAWQPYTNSIVSYNAYLNQVSISDPVTQKRYALLSLPPAGATPGTIGTTQIAAQNGTSVATLTLFGGVAVDPSTNQAFVVQPGANTIQTVTLGKTVSLGGLKTPQITEVAVPSGTPGGIGGVPNAFLPQGTLTSTADLLGVKIFGSGFASGGAQVRLDGTAISTPAPVSDREIDVTIPASFLAAPHHYALDVLLGNGDQSNATDFHVVQAVDLTKVDVNNNPVCTPPAGTPISPSSVAIADQLKNGDFSPIAVVTNMGCKNIAIIDINPTVTASGVTQANPTFGKVLGTVSVGANPQGIAISQHLGLAVVANNGDGTASIVDLTKGTSPVPAVTTGTNPTGVAVNDATGAAIVTNFGSNTISEINLGLLSASTPPTTLTATTIGGIQQPIAVAIDPDRGTNGQGLAVVTALQLIGGSSPIGALYPVEIGLATPTLSTAVSIGSVNATPSGIVFDPAVATNTGHPGVFYVNSSGTNQIYAYNPEGGASPANVGINPTAVAVNPQTGAVLTSNFVGQSISIVDTLSNPFKTRKTLGLPGSAQFGVAIDQFTNLAVIVDQANNRVFLFAMPN